MLAEKMDRRRFDKVNPNLYKNNINNITIHNELSSQKLH